MNDPRSSSEGGRNPYLPYFRLPRKEGDKAISRCLAPEALGVYSAAQKVQIPPASLHRILHFSRSFRQNFASSDPKKHACAHAQNPFLASSCFSFMTTRKAVRFPRAVLRLPCPVTRDMSLRRLRIGEARGRILGDEVTLGRKGRSSPVLPAGV